MCTKGCSLFKKLRRDIKNNLTNLFYFFIEAVILFTSFQSIKGKKKIRLSILKINF